MFTQSIRIFMWWVTEIGPYNNMRKLVKLAIIIAKIGWQQNGTEWVCAGDWCNLDAKQAVAKPVLNKSLHVKYSCYFMSHIKKP